MFYVYLACLLAGGALVVGSLLFGHDHHHGDVGGLAHDGLPDNEIFPFLQMRFWLYLMFVFGLTGTLFELSDVGPTATAIIAGLSGVVGGGAASAILQRLSKRQVSSNLTAKDYIGASARVLLPASPEKKGKIRVFLKGQAHDLQAVVEGEDEVNVKDEVLIVGVEDEVARVAPVGVPKR